MSHFVSEFVVSIRWSVLFFSLNFDILCEIDFWCQRRRLWSWFEHDQHTICVGFRIVIFTVHCRRDVVDRTLWLGRGTPPASLLHRSEGGIGPISTGRVGGTSYYGVE